MWLVAEGMRVEYAEEVYSITEREDKKALSLLCPTKKIFTRGDVLNLSTLSIVGLSPIAHSVADERRTLKPSLTASYQLKRRIGLGRSIGVLISTFSQPASQMCLPES